MWYSIEHPERTYIIQIKGDVEDIEVSPTHAHRTHTHRARTQSIHTHKHTTTQSTHTHTQSTHKHAATHTQRTHTHRAHTRHHTHTTTTTTTTHTEHPQGHPVESRPFGTDSQPAGRLAPAAAAERSRPDRGRGRRRHQHGLIRAGPVADRIRCGSLPPTHTTTAAGCVSSLAVVAQLRHRSRDSCRFARRCGDAVVPPVVTLVVFARRRRQARPCDSCRVARRCRQARL